MTQATISVDQNEQTLNLNQNQTYCLRTINNFGSSTVQNICNGKSVTVQWGSVDWAICFGVIAFALFFAVVIGGLVRLMILD